MAQYEIEVERILPEVEGSIPLRYVPNHIALNTASTILQYLCIVTVPTWYTFNHDKRLMRTNEKVF